MVKNTDLGQQSFSIINTQMTVRSMRDSGYKSTRHALAELIDNSVEAGATEIEVFAVSYLDNGKRRRMKIRELAVLDNGEGMDKNQLRGSLRYGYGTREQRKGIGRFGMGLPNSSMSQARRVDIWSWQSGVSNALHTWLSVDSVEEGMEDIPEPTLQSIPDIYISESRAGFGDSGTLVQWSDLDRVQWSKASTVFSNMENFVGRIYRRFLADPSVRLHYQDDRHSEIGERRSITCIPIENRDGNIIVNEKEIVNVRPNDPLYLMPDTSCPTGYGKGTMFQELKGSPFVVSVQHNGRDYNIRLRASYARPHVRDSSHSDAEWLGRDAGHRPWAKHAAKNMGVSIMRAHREIDLDENWLSGSDTRERWWKVEVDFPTALDEIFGVTNNKQGTMTFNRIAHFDWRRELLDDETSHLDVKRRMREDGDPRHYLLELHGQINKIIKVLRNKVGQSKVKRGSRHNEEKKANETSTSAIKRRIEKGYRGESDDLGNAGTTSEHVEFQVETLVNKLNFDEDTARRRVLATIEENSKVRWVISAQDSPAFFGVESFPNVIQVIFNQDHPVYEYLYDLLIVDPDEIDENNLQDRLDRATAAFHILFYSWARYEEEQMENERERIRKTRWDWGNYAKDFFEEDKLR